MPVLPVEVQLIYWSLYFGLPIILWIVHDTWTRCHCSILVVAILSPLFNDPIMGLSNPGIVIRGSGFIAKSFGDPGVLNSVSLISLHNYSIIYQYLPQYICPSTYASGHYVHEFFISLVETLHSLIPAACRGLDHYLQSIF